MRNPRLIAAMALTVLLAANLAHATSLWMNGPQLRSTLAGQEIAGHYSNGQTFTEEFRADGTLTYMETGIHNTGRWSVSADTFCTIYDGDSKGGCYQVSRVGKNCFEFYFIARTEHQAANPEDRLKPAWTARAWLSDAEATCEAESII